MYLYLEMKQKVYYFLFNTVLLSYHVKKKKKKRPYFGTEDISLPLFQHVGYTLKRILPFKIQSCFTMNDLWPFAPERAESALCSIDPTFDSSRLTQEWVGKAGEWIEKERVHATLKGVRCPLCAIILKPSAFSLVLSFMRPGPCLR